MLREEGEVPPDKVWDLVKQKVDMANGAEREAWIDRKGKDITNEHLRISNHTLECLQELHPPIIRLYHTLYI